MKFAMTRGNRHFFEFFFTTVPTTIKPVKKWCKTLKVFEYLSNLAINLNWLTHSYTTHTGHGLYFTDMHHPPLTPIQICLFFNHFAQIVATRTKDFVQTA